MKKEAKTKRKKKINCKLIYKKINEKLKLEQQRFNSLELLLVTIMALIIGIFISNVSFYLNNNNISLHNNIKEIEKVYNTLLKNYTKDLDSKKLSKAAIEGMMDLVPDQHSEYIDEEDAQDFLEELEGTYEGLGLEVSIDKDNIPIVVNVIPSSPAEEKGIKANDKLIKINDEDVTKMTLDDLTNKIKSSTSAIKLTIKRDDTTFERTISLSTIEIQSVFYEVYEQENKKIGKISISTFAKNTDEQFKKVKEQIDQEEIDSLIIDIRDNLGGNLNTVNNILELFIEKNNVMYQIKKNDKITKAYGSKENLKKYNIVVLINSSSASASEVLASALKEVCNATLIGTKTYGKGTVQTTMRLSSGAIVKYTTEEWLTSKGNSINKVGISPDIEVVLQDKYYETGSEIDDNQLQQAITTILNNQ